MIITAARIKNDNIDRYGKTILIILLAASCLIANCAFRGEDYYVQEVVSAGAASLALIVISMIKTKINTMWMYVPMVLFTIVQIKELLMSAYIQKLSILMLLKLLLVVVSIITCTEMTTDDHNAGHFSLEITDRNYSIRKCMLIIIFINCATCCHGLIDPTYSLTDYIDNTSQIAFFIAYIILLLPEGGMLNIRRITLTAGYSIALFAITFGMIYILAKPLSLFEESRIMMITLSLIITEIMVIIRVDTIELPIFKKEDDGYRRGKKKNEAMTMNKPIGGMSRIYYLESAFRRDFVKEYSIRFYNDMDYAEDIASIQQRLKEIQIQRNILNEDNYFYNRHAIEALEQEGCNLLGILCIAYNFDTGITDCPLELLIRNKQNGNGK